MNKAIVILFLCGPYIHPFVFSQAPIHQNWDSTSIKNLLAHAVELAESDPDKSRQVSTEALRRARLIKFNVGVAKSLNHIGWLYQLKSTYDSSIYFYKAGLRTAQQSDLRSEEAHSWQGLGESYMRLFASDSARKYLLMALDFSKQINDKSFEAGIVNNIANIYLNENRLEEALSSFIKSANLYDSLNNKGGLSRALSNIGNIEYRLNHLEKAIDYTNRSKILALTSGHIAGVGYAHKLLGWIHRKQGTLEKALLHYDSAIDIYNSLNAKRDVAEISLSMGNAYYDLQDFNKAIDYYQQTLRSSRKSDYKPFVPYAYSGLASCYYSLDGFDKGLQYADSLALTAKKINPYLQLDALDLKSMLYEKKNNYKQALFYSRAFQMLKDSLTALENTKAVEEIEAKFQNDLKQNEIDQLKITHSLRESRLQTIQLAVVFAILFILAIAILVINRYRVVNRAKRQLEIERMRNTIAQDLHDDIGSALSSINIVSQLALNKTEEETNRENFLRIREQSSRIMESMSDIVWSINPGNDSLDKVVMKMREFAAEILESRNIQLQFKSNELPFFVLNSEQRKNIFLIFKEAINNAAKYSEGKNVVVALSVLDQRLLLEIKDDGKGFDIEKIKQGNGISNMKARALSLNGKIEIDSKIGNGCAIALSMSLT